MKLWAAAAALTVAAAAAASACKDDAHCDVDYFCSFVLSECQACLRCADYSRRDADGCAKAADDCGECLPGYESSYQSHECVDAAAAEAAAAAADAERRLPYYVWVPMLIGTLLVLIALAVVCASRIKRSKLFRPASYGAPGDTEAPRCASPPPPLECSAPPPPPYNDAVNNNYPPTSPFAPPDRNGHGGHKPDDAGDASVFLSEGAPRPKFVERSDSVLVHGNRETDTGQEARVYSNPHYITAPQLPPSYDDALSEPSDSNDLPEDEETVASTWTHDTEPAQSHEEQSLSALLSEARGRELVRAPERDPAEPAAKLLCVRPQERSRAAEDATDAPSTSGGPHPSPSASSAAADTAAPAPAAAAANSNVTFTINFQQLNDVKLLRL